MVARTTHCDNSSAAVQMSKIRDADRRPANVPTCISDRPFVAINLFRWFGAAAFGSCVPAAGIRPLLLCDTCRATRRVITTRVFADADQMFCHAKRSGCCHVGTRSGPVRVRSIECRSGEIIRTDENKFAQNETRFIPCRSAVSRRFYFVRRRRIEIHTHVLWNPKLYSATGPKSTRQFVNVLKWL